MDMTEAAPWAMRVNHPAARPPNPSWIRLGGEYESEDEPGFRAIKDGCSWWIVSLNGRIVGFVYHVIPRNWVLVMDENLTQIANVTGGFDGRERAMSFLVHRAKEAA